MSTSLPRRCCFPAARPLALASLALIGIAAGCQPASQPVDTPAADPSAADADAPAEPTAEAADQAANAAAAPRRAQAGVAKRGRSLDDQTGVGRMIAQPAITLFAVQERAVFDIQIPHALQLFEATEGRRPKSHQEFMQRIVKANRIALPELPAGSQYRYDPEKGELWVYPQQ